MIDWDQLQADWILAGEPTLIPRVYGGWDPSILHVTDIGSCPRKVALRLGGEVEQRPPQEYIMLNAGTRRHWDIYNALAHAGYEFDHEVPVPLPDGWSGTADLLIQDWTSCDLKDFKTVRANAFKWEEKNPSWPKAEHQQQVTIYRLFLGRDIQYRGVLYMDRDGSNKTQEKQVYLDLTVSGALDLMHRYELVRDGLPDLPPKLGRSLQWKNKRPIKSGFSGDLYDSPDWRCMYCWMRSCEQHHSNDVMLAQKRAKGLELTEAGRRDPALVYDFLEREPDHA